MTPYIADADFQLYVGDVRDVLATLPDGSVDCVVTSPPYWGLRDYGTGQWDGGDPDCDHQRPELGGDGSSSGLNAKYQTDGRFADDSHSQRRRQSYAGACGKCGARRVDRQLGLEPTPDAYVANMVAVFRQLRRVLADHGTCWVDLGDSYAAANNRNDGSRQVGTAEDSYRDDALRFNQGTYRRIPGLKPKDLVGIPWRVALALQADGWYLRADIIWAKPNPMPESVTDRPTKAHEYVFLLTKRPRYWFDQEAVRERYIDGDPRPPHGPGQASVGGRAGSGTRAKGPDGRGVTQVVGQDGSIQHRNGERWPNPTGRNVRSVWEIATQPYPEAHFATFPEELARRCIVAGCPEFVCRVCGAPRVRLVERGESDYARIRREEGHAWTDMDAAALERGTVLRAGEGGQTRRANGTVPSLRAAETQTLGWSDCGHGDYRAGVVLDPFLGSGTTALVARRHGRHSVGVELSPEYAGLAARRLQQLSLLAEGAL